MNAKLVSNVVCYASLVVVLVVVGTPAPADVITIGDVDPGGAATQARSVGGWTHPVCGAGWLWQAERDGWRRGFKYTRSPRVRIWLNGHGDGHRLRFAVDNSVGLYIGGTGTVR